MWDSSAKLPSGILDMHLHDLGNYQECLDVPQIGPYHVKYCLVEVKHFLPPATPYTEFNNTERILFGSIKILKNSLYLARCVPASCDNEDLKKYYTSIVNEYNMTVDIDDFSCTASDETEPLTMLDWGAIIFLATTIGLLVSSTAVHCFSSKDDKPGVFKSLILCFSLLINLDQIITKKNLTSNLSFLSGLRSISMVFIIFGHSAISLISFPKINYFHGFDGHIKPSIAYLMAATFNLAVDVFFVISGLLISYLQIRNNKMGRPFNFSLHYIRRFFRIIPPYASQILIFVTLIYRYAGSGPLWKPYIGAVRENCLRNWWTNLLFINNYVNQDKMCIATNWYLAVDMQLYIIAPVIFLSMIKWKMFRKYLIPVLIIISNLWTFFDSYINEYRAGSMIDSKFRTERTNQYIYITTQSRIGGWLMGLYLGYILQEIEDNPKKKYISKIALWIGWSFTVLVQICAVLSLDYFMSDHQYINLIGSLYNGFHRTIFSLSICWLIYACELGYGGFFYEILTWYPLQVLGRLTFTTYLSQMLVLMGIDSTTTTSLDYRPYIELQHTVTKIALCFVQAFFLSLMFELPYANIGRIFSAVINNAFENSKEESKAAEMIDNTHQNGEKVS